MEKQVEAAAGTGKVTARLREVALGDYEQVKAVLVRNGLEMRPLEDWSRQISTNPLRVRDGLNFPAGWVLADPKGAIVGFFGNIPVAYGCNRKRYIAMVPSSWAVDPLFRNQSLLLLSRFFSQPQADLFVNTTASTEAGRVFHAFGSRPVPVPYYDQPVFWVCEPVGFMESCFRKRGWAGGSLLKYPAGFGFGIANGLRKWTLGQNPEGRAQSFNSFDERFDEFWADLSLKPDRLQAWRSRAWLEWHCGPRLQQQKIWGFAVMAGRRLAGYALVQRQDVDHIGLRRAQLVDLQVPNEDPDLIKSLLGSALRRCEDERIHVLEAAGFASPKRAVLESMRPWRRKWPAWPAYYKTGSAELASVLAGADGWDVCQYDGDASL